MCSLWFLCIIILTLFNNLNAKIVFPLQGTWMISNSNKSIDNITTSIPSGIYSALMENGIIGDVLYADNDVKTRWIAHDNWTYTKTFKVSHSILKRQHAIFVFNGLDTFAEIRLNDHLVGTTDNMFVRYRFNVKHFLSLGLNKLEVKFTSAILVAKQRQEELYTAPKCTPIQYNGECGVNMIRKMQASFAWDWGPAFPSQGIWKPVWLESYTNALIRDINVETKFLNKWEMVITIYLEAGVNVNFVEGTLEILLGVIGHRNQTLLRSRVTAMTNSEGELTKKYIVEISENKVEKWWPNGLGSQNLYPLTAVFHGHDDALSSSKTIQVGFREIELVQESLDPEGLSFYFRVNGQPVFMKGSNWIPGHILPEWGANYSSIHWLLTSAKEASMNMLRVWGGGVYESDEFYTICDELGILIWQDFMFACSMYPTDNEFIRSVKTEIIQNTRRLQSHPSVAIWAGNNENELALRGNWYSTEDNYTRYANDYVQLYVGTIKNSVQTIDPSRPFVVSSPSNGIASEKEGFISLNPQNPHYGDMHVYNYFDNGWNPNIYPRARFVSEYGIQSLPSLSSWRESGSMFDHRQHLSQGYKLMALLISKNLALPNVTNDNFEKTFFYYSQINQAMSMRAETEAYRVGQGTIAQTSGALFWQLNDVWVAPSWSAIEFGGNWKMLQYHAMEFFSSTMVVLQLSPDNKFMIYVVRDEPDKLFGKIQVSYYSWDDMTAKAVEDINFTVLGHNATLIESDWLKNRLEWSSCTRDTCVITARILNPQSTQIGPESVLFLNPLKDAIGLKIPHLEAKVIKCLIQKPKDFCIQVNTDAITPFVWLEVPGIRGHFSKNGYLQVNAEETIKFYSQEDISTDMISNLLKVTSLLSIKTNII